VLALYTPVASDENAAADSVVAETDAGDDSVPKK
jgi:hypothetical protein